jgi:hypothetical protein
MSLALNMAKMAKGGFSRSAVEEIQYLIKKPRAEVREEKQQSSEFPGHHKVKAGIARNRAMLRQTRLPDVFLAKMAQQRIHRRAADTIEQVHLRPTNADSRIQSRYNS